MKYLVRVVCVHIRGVSPIQGAGLEGFHCTVYTQGTHTIHSVQKFYVLYEYMCICTHVIYNIVNDSKMITVSEQPCVGTSTIQDGSLMCVGMCAV